MNCIDNECKYTYSYLGETYCQLTKQEIPDNIDIIQCGSFKQARTCINCKYSIKTIYETGTIDDIEYRCILQNNKLIYDDLYPMSTHYFDVPECDIDQFKNIESQGEK